MSKTLKTVIVFALVLSLVLMTTGAVFAGAAWDDPCNRGGQCFEAPAKPSCQAGFKVTLDGPQADCR